MELCFIGVFCEKRAMMKKLILLLFLIMPCAFASAQVNEKLSATTKMFLQRYARQKEGNIAVRNVEEDLLLGKAVGVRKPLLAETQTIERVEYIPAFIRVDSASVGALSKWGVLVDSRFNGFVTARIPVDKVTPVYGVT